MTASPEEPLVAAVIRTARAHVDRLPVVDRAGHAVGILARDDVVHALAGGAVHVEEHPEPRRPMLVPD